jgi:dihydrofolate synthase/folylpolyglutamate synthase
LDEDIEKKASLLAQNLSLPEYLYENLCLALCALKFLQLDIQKVFVGDGQLFGRLSRIRENIIVDVGHNILAAQKILESLRGEKYTLVYNSYKDKNYPKILEILKPIIKEVAIIKVSDKRIIDQKVLESVLKKLDIKYNNFNSIDENKNYLVFGSFSVVESFLKVM